MKLDVPDTRSNWRRRGMAVFVVACALTLGACQRQSADSLPMQASSSQHADNADWIKFVDAFEEGFFKFEPAFAVSQGRHEYDGQLPDWSADAIKKEIEWLSSQRTAAAAFAKTELSAPQKFEQEYMLAVIDGNLFWMKEVEQPFTNPAYYMGSLDPSVYLTRPYAALDKRMQAFVTYLRNVPGAAKHIRDNLRLPLPKTFVTFAMNGFNGFASFYRQDVPQEFASIKDAKLQADLKAAIEPAAKAMQQLGEWLNTQQASATNDFALGQEQFAHMLQATERVTTPLDKLMTVGQADLQRNLKALNDACAQFAPQASIKDCVAKVNAHKPDGGPVAAGKKQLSELRQFVIDRNLVTVPGDEAAEVDEAPPYNRWNLAYINVPGPYDKGMPSTYYIAPPDPKWSKADQLAYIPSNAFLEFVSVHEVWPGHFLQFLHANRSPSRFGQLFVGYGFAEGWAHYAEEMMWDAGLGNGDPEMHIGQLMNALMRNVRFICAIGLHTQRMSVDTCETLFRDQAQLDPGNAKQQAARGTYDPAYLNYTLSKLMIKKMREDWTASRGGRQAWKEFHDQFLSFGGPPVALVRQQMLPGNTGELF